MLPAPLILAALSAAAVAALAAIAQRARRDDPATAAAESTAVAAFVDPLRAMFASAGDGMRAIWTPPAAAAPYLERIANVSEARGVPADLLARLIYQETRFRPDIIDGTTRSAAGAIGIGQFLPATAAELELDPLDTDAAIDGIAVYLSRLRDRFGSWAEALAAYNWGQGNWQAYRDTGRGARGQARPKENIDYVAQIGADVALA
jgi:soluble lytic murein transglycosylase-like protein